jgi:hypothetical protein
MFDPGGVLHAALRAAFRRSHVCFARGKEKIKRTITSSMVYLFVHPHNPSLLPNLAHKPFEIATLREVDLNWMVARLRKPANDDGVNPGIQCGIGDNLLEKLRVYST